MLFGCLLNLMFNMLLPLRRLNQFTPFPSEHCSYSALRLLVVEIRRYYFYDSQQLEKSKLLYSRLSLSHTHSLSDAITFTVPFFISFLGQLCASQPLLNLHHQGERSRYVRFQLASGMYIVDFAVFVCSFIFIGGHCATFLLLQRNQRTCEQKVFPVH
jgi:hypothetical protein